MQTRNYYVQTRVNFILRIIKYLLPDEVIEGVGDGVGTEKKKRFIHNYLMQKPFFRGKLLVPTAENADSTIETITIPLQI